MKLSVVIPVYNEAAGIGPTLNALLNQSDRDFDVVFCDNNSTDGTGELIREFAAARALCWVVVEEARKGTGAAADTACRAAIARGATHLARTDADCIPAPNWVEAIKSLFDRGFEFISGWSEARTDDPQFRRRGCVNSPPPPRLPRYLAKSARAIGVTSSRVLTR